MPVIDEIIRTRRKTIALIIQPDGRLVVRAPLHASESRIHEFVRLKAGWIITRQEQAKIRHAQRKIISYTNGASFLYVGRRHRLEIVPAQRPALSLDGHFRLSQASLPKAREVFTRWYRQQARTLFQERVRVFAARHGFAYQKIRISSARTRWGSCSANGTLSFTWRLAMAPMEVIDYVVVHELVHTRCHNHSKKYWAQVAAIRPDYKRMVKWLKVNGETLSLD